MSNRSGGYSCNTGPTSVQPEVHVIKLHKSTNGMGLSIVAAKVRKVTLYVRFSRGTFSNSLRFTYFTIELSCFTGCRSRQTWNIYKECCRRRGCRRCEFQSVYVYVTFKYFYTDTRFIVLEGRRYRFVATRYHCEQIPFSKLVKRSISIGISTIRFLHL